MVILVPVRANSQRIPGKAMKPLGGHPLLAYTLATALQVPGADVLLVSNDQAASDYALSSWPLSVFARSDRNAQALSPDIDWLQEVEREMFSDRPDAEPLMLLRVTSPFRRSGVVRSAWEEWEARWTEGASSLRLLTPTRAHPAKSWWTSAGGWMQPVLPGHTDKAPWHSSPTQVLPLVYQQTAGMECTTWGQIRAGSLAGDRVAGYVVDGPAALDLNTPEDWDYAEYLVATGRAELPTIPA